MNTPAILDPYDSTFMTDFFRNPDSIGEHFGDWMVNQPNIKMDGSGLVHLPNFDPSSHNITTPPVTPGGHAAQSHLTHTSHQQHMPMASHVPAYVGHNVIDGRSSYLEENDLSAASGLYHMQRAGRQSTSNSYPTAQHINGAGAGVNWSIETGHQMSGGQGPHGRQDNLQSPLTPSRRQPSNSYHSQPQLLNPQHPDYVPRTQQWQTAWPDSQQAVPGARYPAHMPSGQPFDLYPDVFAGGVMSSNQSAQPRSYSGQRPTEIPFGTDINFTGRHYQPPRGSILREDEKGANLNNVPFAGELAGHGHPHAHPFTSSPTSHSHQPHNFPAYASFSHTQSSPAMMGGLPVTSPFDNSHRRSLPVSNMAHDRIESPDLSDDDENEFEDHEPSKRRKSQAQRQEDEEYTPTGHMKTPNPKRGTKAARSGNGVDDESFDNNHTAASSRSKPSKRRKMSPTGRASPGSQEYGTPRVNESESPEPSSKSGSKKKSRAATQASKSNNLTEEEKRQNHIRSEKTRRDLIKWQYDALDELVPGLKSGKSGLSRADVLLEIVGYVENVKLGNEKMEELLASWKAGGGLAPGGGYG